MRLTEKNAAVAFDSRKKPQIGTAEWITDYPTAAGFFSPLFTCASFQPRSLTNINGAEFCNRRLDRKVSLAVSEQTTNPDAAQRLIRPLTGQHHLVVLRRQPAEQVDEKTAAVREGFSNLPKRIRPSGQVLVVRQLQ